MSDIPLLLVFLLAVAVLLRQDFVYYIIYVVAGAYLLSRWWTSRSLPRLRVKHHFNDHIFLGETVTVGLEIANGSWAPMPWLRCEESPPSALATGPALRQVIALRPKGRVSLAYELLGRRRGYYEIGPATFSSGDLFGFAESAGRQEQPDHLTVYPRVIPLGQVELTSRSPHGAIKSQQPIFADPARPIGKRPYIAGDSWRSIDWKSTARAGSLQVKKVEPAVSLTTVIFLDLNANAYSRQLRVSASEWAIVLAASLANYLVEQRQAVGLASNGVDQITHARCWSIPCRPGRIHLMKLLEWLARVQLAETTPLTEWLVTEAAGLAWGTTVIAITPTGDEALCRSLHRLLRSGLNPVLAVTEPHGQFALVRERARRLGVAAHLVSDEHELAHWCTARRGVVV